MPARGAGGARGPDWGVVLRVLPGYVVLQGRLRVYNVSSITWGFASPLVKYASLSGPTLAFYRLWLGAMLLLLVLRVTQKTLAPKRL